MLKIFRILAQQYAAHSRHRRRRFGLRFNFISGLYNCGLNLKQQRQYTKKRGWQLNQPLANCYEIYQTLI